MHSFFLVLLTTSIFFINRRIITLIQLICVNFATLQLTIFSALSRVALPQPQLSELLFKH